MDESLEWSHEVKVSAKEIQLLTGGNHLTKPETKEWLPIAIKPKNGDLRDWELLSLPILHGTEYLPNFIESMLSQILDEDAYNGINSMYRPKSYRNTHQLTHRSELHHLRTPDGEPLKAGFRSSTAVARLNACFVDIDYYDMNLTAGNVIGQIYDLQNEGKFPPPTYLKDSGRGLWAVWLLGIEPRSYAEHVRQWAAIQAKLNCMFRNQNADPTATDAARLTRIVGSRNTKSNRRANMVIFARDTEGKPIRYALNELATHLDCKIQPPPKRNEVLTRLAPSAKAVKGAIERWRLDELRFWTLVETIRRIIPAGRRNDHAFILGAILRHRHRSTEERATIAHDAAIRLHRAFDKTSGAKEKHDYPVTQIEREILNTMTKRQLGVKIAAKSIVNRLQVTTDEAAKLRDLVPSNSGGYWPPADGQEPLIKTLTRPQQKQVIQDWLTRNNFIMAGPSSRSLAEIIRDELGIEVTHATISTYRKALAPPQPKPEFTQSEILNLEDFLTQGNDRS